MTLYCALSYILYRLTHHSSLWLRPGLVKYMLYIRSTEYSGMQSSTGFPILLSRARYAGLSTPSNTGSYLST